MRAVPLALLLLFVGCKGSAVGGGRGTAVSFVDAPAPVLPEGWVATTHPVGFSIALPPGWQTMQADRAAIEEFVKGRNENAWTAMNETKADVDLDKATAMFAQYEFMDMNAALLGSSVRYGMHAIREEVGGRLTLEEAVSRWKDTIYGGSSPPHLFEKDVQLPVGPAKLLTATRNTLGIKETDAVYFLVDGGVQYTVFFGEWVYGKFEPLDTQAIMETFRPSPP